jgi:hypothetical protein
MHLDELVKSLKSVFFVIPEEAGIQYFQQVIDSGFRRSDDVSDFFRSHESWYYHTELVSRIYPLSGSFRRAIGTLTKRLTI